MSESMMGGRAVDAGRGWTWIADGFVLLEAAGNIDRPVQSCFK